MSRTAVSGRGPLGGALLILATLFVAAACGAVGGAAPSPTPPPGPTAGPATPAPVPTAVPTDAPDNGVRLDVADPHEVVVDIDDPKGLLAGADSGRAGDGMSVRWGKVEVVNLDEDTLRVTWVGLPTDARVGLRVAAADGGYALTVTQPAPPAYSDALGFDRVLLLDFASPVKAGDVAVDFVEA